MRYAVESWAPEYTSAVDAQVLEPSTAHVDVDVELSAREWRPLTPARSGARRVLFVDGVRRIDARVWIGGATGAARPGLAASYAAGVVCCDGQARLDAAEVRRVLISAVADAEPISTRCGTYAPVLADGDGTDEQVAALQQQMRALERLTAAGVGPADLVVVDGPLSRPSVPCAVGYVKTHQRAYLQPELSRVVGALSAGQRTPLFATTTKEKRFSWYARLPGPADHAWSGIVRGELPGDLPTSEARGFADLATATWPRFASAPHKDSRAPQNLHPIAGLERALRHRLGDWALLYRSLRAAAAVSDGRRRRR